jgi:ribosomal protein S15P/S13E
MKPTKIASKDQQIKCLLNEINILKQHLTPVEIADYEQRLHAKFLQKRHNSEVVLGVIKPQ